jgi:signal transduction histidine kinase
MGYAETTADFDTAIMEAGDRFVAQVQPVLHPQSLAVILLDREGDPGRVAFTWGAPHRFGIPQHASIVHEASPESVSEQSIRINLEGRDGALGAVLLRGDFPGGYHFRHPLPLQAITQELALALENIQLKERLQRKLADDQALENIASLVAADLTPGTTYLRFADEVASLIRYDRISVYLADEKDSALSLVFQHGAGVRHTEPGSISSLDGADPESIASCGEGLIVQGNGQPASWPRLGLEDDSDYLSTLIVPIRHASEVVGVVVSASRLTNAYGQAELALLSKAAAFLGPWIANSRLTVQLKGKVDESAFMNSIGRAVGPTNGSEDVFGDLAKALDQLIPFQRGTLTWVDPDGKDISVLHWPAAAIGVELVNNAVRHTLKLNFESGKQEIGALLLERDGGLGFMAEETRMLERLAPQIAHVVHNMRLYQHVERQALQIEVLKRDGQPVNQASVERSDRRELTADAVLALRTPLTAIKGYSSALLQPDISLPPEIYREFLETIDQEADRLNQVIGELSTTLQVQPDLAWLKVQNSSIEILFDQVQADLGLAGWSKTVSFRCAPGLPVVMADPARLVQVLSHLIRCAAEFTQPDEVIHVEACLRGGRTTIVIGASDKAQPGRKIPRPQRISSLATDARPERSSLNRDFRVVVAKNLLIAHDVKLRVLPQKWPSEIFSFPMPAS